MTTLTVEVATAGLSINYLPGYSPEKMDVGMAPKWIKCSHCNTPIAEIVSGSLIIRSRHHGEKHTTVIPISRL